MKMSSSNNNNFQNKHSIKKRNKVSKFKNEYSNKKRINNLEKLKSEQYKTLGNNINLNEIENKITQLREIEESGNRKAKKKIRRLEYIKKKYTQMKLTEESLQVNSEISDNEKELTENHSLYEDIDDINNEETIKDDLIKDIKRFVVFVGNLPKAVTEENLKNHFSKVGPIKSVRIPECKESRKGGFAFIEVEDRIAFEKTLSMHHTMLNNKRINVLFTNPDGSNLNLKEIKKKNSKFTAMRKAGLLIGSIPEHKKRSFRRKKKRLAEAKASTSIRAN